VVMVAAAQQGHGQPQNRALSPAALACVYRTAAAEKLKKEPMTNKRKKHGISKK